MSAPVRSASVAERLVDAVAALAPERIPAEVRSRCEDLLLDVAGLCVAARRSVPSALAAYLEARIAASVATSMFLSICWTVWSPL